MRSSVVESHPAAEVEKRRSVYQHQPAYRPPFNPPPTPATAKPALQASKLPLVLAPAEGWFALVLLAIAVYTVVFSIISAKWVGHTTILFWSATVGLLIGLLIAKVRRVPQVVLHLAACLVGHWLSIWLTSALAFHISWVLVLASLRTAITGGLSTTTGTTSDVIFLFYLSFLCFYLGYFGTWLTYRAHLPWLVALVYCSVLLINLNYAKQDFSALTFILLAALALLIARIQFVTQLAYWTSQGLHTQHSWLRKTTRHFMQGASVLVLLTLLISWGLPILAQPAAGATFWNYLDNAWTNISHGNVSWRNPGALIQPYPNTANFFGDHLTLTGHVHLPVGEVLYYSSTAAPQYLEGFTYEHFDGHTWISALPGGTEDFAPGEALPHDTAGAHYSTATTDVTIVQPPTSPRNYIFAPAQPASFDIATSVSIDGMAGDWEQQRPLAAGEHYRATSNITTATIQELSAIPLPAQDRTAWASDRNYSTLVTYYIQIPDHLSPIVATTMQQWTQGATNAYDAVEKLETHLNDSTQFKYSISNSPIPDNMDAVTWLLQTRNGYCTYYATAMAVMARMLGIPSRIANGFSYGHFDLQRNVWVVDGIDAHSWVQIYFPGYGWINFDPTPGFSVHTSPQPTHRQLTSPPLPTKRPMKATPTPALANKPLTRRAEKHPVTSAVTPTQATPQNLVLGLSIVTLLCTVFLLLVAFCSYWWRSFYTNTKIISGMFWRTCRIASWAGVPPRDWQTPYEYSRTLSRYFPREAVPLRRLTELFVRDRWAAPHETPYLAEEDDLERLWPHLRRELLRLVVLRIRNSFGGEGGHGRLRRPCPPSPPK